MSQDNKLTNIIRDLEKKEKSAYGCSGEEWSDLHGRIIQLPRTERRQLYKDKEYLPLEEVLDWQQTCPQDKRITDAGTNSEEDIRIAFEINKRVAIWRGQAATIECDALLLPFHTLFNMNGSSSMVGRFTIDRECRFPVNNIYTPLKFPVDENTVIEFLNLATQSGCRSLVIDLGSLWLQVYVQQRLSASPFLCNSLSQVRKWLEQNYKLVDKIIICAQVKGYYKKLTENEKLYNLQTVMMPTYFPVYVANIPESKLPAEILRMDSRSIEIFKKALSDGKHVVHNIRVMLVGHSGVGKTTVLKRLLGQEVDIDKRESTDGIEVHVHRCKVDIDSGQWTLCEDGAPDPNKVLASTMLSVSADESVLPPFRESSPQPGTIRGDHTEVKYTQKQNVSSRTESDTDEPLSTKAKLEVGASSGNPTSGCGSSSTSIEDSTKGNETQLAQTLKEVIQASNNLPDSKFATVSFWDFAGQSIFYNTHQVFLALRTIFLLVTNLIQDIDEVMPDGETLCLEKNGTKVRDFVDFWANSVHYFCGKQDTTGPPIILVATHADKVDQAIKEAFIKNHFQKIRDIFDDKVTADHIQAGIEHAIDNTGVDSQLEKLKSEIFNIAKKQKYWEEEYPNCWLTLEKELFNKRQSGTKILTLEEVKDLNRSQAVPLEETDNLDLFLRMHHEQGNLLFFSEETLNNYILLDPQWVIDALKCIITADNLEKCTGKVRKNWKQLKETGKLTMDIIDAVWEESEFDQHKDVLLLIMERLSLIAKPKDDDPTYDYFVPCFISSTNRHINPSELKTQPVTSVLNLAVTSRFFPVVLFNKLIASCIEKYPIYMNHIYNDSAEFVVGVHVFTVLYVDNTVKVWVTTPRKIKTDVCQDILKFLIECIEKLCCNDVDVCICCPIADLYVVNDMFCPNVSRLPKDITQWRKHFPDGILCLNPSCKTSSLHSRQEVLRHWIPSSQRQTHQAYKKALAKAQTSLVEDMHTNELLDIFAEKEFLSPIGIQDIRDEKLTSNRNRAIVETVSTLGPDKYELFKECLTRIGQVHLVKLLENYEREIAAQDENDAIVTPDIEIAAQDEADAIATSYMGTCSNPGVMAQCDVDLDNVTTKKPIESKKSKKKKCMLC